jgi:hypothetical protein
MDTSLEDREAEVLKLAVEKRRRMRNAMVVVPAFFGTLILLVLPLLGEQYIEYGLGIRRDALVFSALGFLMVSGANVLMTYLQTGFKKSADEEVSSLKLKAELERLRAEANQSFVTKVSHLSEGAPEIESLRSEIESLKAQVQGIDKDQFAGLVETIKKEVATEAGAQLISELQKKLAESVTTQAREREVSRNFEETRNRLSLEIAALGRRGNLNLILGIITTVSGLVLLATFVFSQTDTPTETIPFALHFLPRLTLVLFIEIFAYFFLRLYKSSLSEIKYFQNELTNVEQKNAALISSIQYGENAVRNEVISKLASTERNHVLEKGQTTVELEKTRIEKEGLSDMAKRLAELLPKKS